MAFNWQTFRTRTFTAAIFVVVMLACLLMNKWTFFILFTVIHFGAWWEYLKLVEKIHGTPLNNYLKPGFMLTGFGLMTALAGSEYSLGGFGLAGNFSLMVYAAGFGLLIIGIFKRDQLVLRQFSSALAGLGYISLTLGLLVRLYARTNVFFPDVSPDNLHLHHGFFAATSCFYPAFIIACLWINDTMAYIVGSLIGKTPMSTISPKKTWEGTVGGIIFCTVVIFLLSNFVFHFGTLSYELLVLSAIVSITGTLGDLLESKLKRMAGVKDSGHIMPGHGGFLDRFDSLLIATPFAWCYIVFLGQ